MLQQLCHKENLKSGLLTECAFRKKEKGRLNAHCRCGGGITKGVRYGKRDREWEKVGCGAKVTKLPLNRHNKSAKPEMEIRERVKPADKEASLYGERIVAERDFPDVELCLINHVCLTHSGHVPDLEDAEMTYLTSVGDLVSHEKSGKELKEFLSIFDW